MTRRRPGMSEVIVALMRWPRERRGRAALALRRKALAAWVAAHPGWRLTDCDDQTVAFAVAQLIDTPIDDGIVLAGPAQRLVFEVRSEAGWVTAGLPYFGPTFRMRLDKGVLVAEGPGRAGLTAALFDGLSPSASARAGGGWLRLAERGAVEPATVDLVCARLDGLLAALAANAPARP